ncbi:Prenylated Rab acceptor 1 [Mucor velutinosus]|uniref:Prenylated Rab acceptor 1 n=1 Tax=Mucor velutinosus TaxID=708070 RepID=A0AAN7DR80_9FUNG|nr:Prenylated Rab acceptor 1 [Mucor velutinosus]
MPRGKNTSVAESSSQRPLRNRTVPDMFKKQKAADTRRRIIQRDSSEDEDDEAEEDELNSSDSESDSDHDTRTTKSKRKATAAPRRKAAKTVPSAFLNNSSQLLIPVTQDSSTQDSLYEKALIPETDMEDVAEAWVKHYKAHQLAALRDLINLVIRSSGCPMAITIDAINQEDGSYDALQELQAELVKLPPTEYPFVSNLKEFKTLKRNILLFFYQMIEMCQHQAIYDGVLIETLQNWLTTMSSSTYRPFRHTATLVSLRIMDQLCTLAEKAQETLNNAKRHLTAETKKKKPTKSRITTLKQTCVLEDRKCKDLQEYLTEFFDNIFVHRARDVESVIRHECFKELCNWMLNYQSFFVSNNYIRFFGWAFNDQSASVRSEALKSLIKLYKVESIAPKLNNFTRRFTGRIEEMALYDVDVSVRISAIQLCSALYKQNINILSAEGRSQLTNMIASDASRVRKSAAPFVKTLIESNVIAPLVAQVTQTLTGKNGRRAASTTATPVNTTWVTFKAISAFLVEQTASILGNEDTDAMQVDLESMTSTLVEKRTFIITNIIEALWGQIPQLQDINAMTDYLYRDHSQSQQQQNDDDAMDTESSVEIEDCYRLTEDEETILVNVYVACIQTAMSKGLDKNLPESKDRRKLDDTFWDENKNELSRHLVQSLPKLLPKHLEDPNRMTRLATLPTLMNLNVYMELRAEKEYEHLLETLIRVYLGATSTELLKNCADSLQHLSKNTSLNELNQTHLGELKDAVVDQVREACKGKDLVTCNYTPSLLHSVSVSMLRLSCLTNFCDATTAMEDSQGTSMNVLEYAGALAERAAFLKEESEEKISIYALTVLSRYMMWKCQNLATAIDTNELGLVIERRRDWVMDKYTEILKSDDGNISVKVQVTAFGYLVDLYWLFTSDLFESYGLNRLKTKCPADLQETSVELVKEQIKKVKQCLDDYDEDIKKTKDVLATEKGHLHKLMTSFSRGVLMGVFDIHYATFILNQYGTTDASLDDVIKSLVAEFQSDLIASEVAADGICRAYLEALKNSFDTNVSEAARSVDKTLKLARLEANSMKRANSQDVARKVPPQIVCERIHLDGITYCLSKAAEAYRKNRDDERDNALKFFKVLTVFSTGLTRARDVARIHNHLEDSLQQNGLYVEEGKKEWEHYVAYVQSIDQFLKIKGLRYDATKRANNPETPAAHVFNDVNLGMLDEPEAESNQDTNKRPLTEVDMDIDEDSVPKRRR